MVVAAFARSADAGAAIGLILLCLERRDRVGDPVLLGSVLAGAIVAPHVLGPLLARRLDAARDARRPLAVALIGYGVFLGAAAALIGRAPAPVPVGLAALAGVCGPLLTGGMSSQLVAITGEQQRARRRGEGLDAVTYGLSGTVGPALVAAIAAAAGAGTAVGVLVGASALAGLGMLTLPRASPDHVGADQPLRTSAVFRALLRTGPLRRSCYATMIVSLVLGGLAVIAVAASDRLGAGAATAATLMAAFGGGNLVASLLIALRPWRGDPERASGWMLLAVVGALLVCAAAGSVGVAVAGYALLGATQGPYVAAAFSVRSEYAPEGARAQVFVTLAALKVAAGSLGAPLVGLLSGAGPRYLLLGGAVLVALTAAGFTLDRRRRSTRRDSPPPAALS